MIRKSEKVEKRSESEMKKVLFTVLLIICLLPTVSGATSLNLRVGTVGTDYVKISWDKSPDLTFRRYEIYVCSPECELVREIRNRETTSYTITHLSPGKSYNIYVKNVCLLSSADSNTVTVRTKSVGSSSGTSGIVWVIFLLIGLFIVKKITGGKKPSEETPTSSTSPNGEKPSTSLEDKYELLEFIGEGGFAEVWKAKRRKDNKIVALKLPRALTQNGENIFLRELGVWHLLKDCRNILELYDCGIAEYRGKTQAYIAMELGEHNLREKLPMGIDEACRVMLEIANALACAHNSNILHRDIKPENIIFVKGIPKLSDFGISKIRTSKRYSKTPVGTFEYLAPEQFDSSFGKVDKPTDIYQFGVTFYEVLTGKLPHRAEEEGKYIYKVLYENPEPLEGIPEELEKIIMKCLAKKPRDRYREGEELRNAIAKYLGIRLKKTRDKRLSTDLCLELLEFHLTLKNTEEALKYACLLRDRYVKEDLRKDAEKICEHLKYCLENEIEISEEFVKKASVFVHQGRMGCRT